MNRTLVEAEKEKKQINGQILLIRGDSILETLVKERLKRRLEKLDEIIVKA